LLGATEKTQHTRAITRSAIFKSSEHRGLHLPRTNGKYRFSDGPNPPRQQNSGGALQACWVSP